MQGEEQRGNGSSNPTLEGADVIYPLAYVARGGAQAAKSPINLQTEELRIRAIRSGIYRHTQAKTAQWVRQHRSYLRTSSHLSKNPHILTEENYNNGIRVSFVIAHQDKSPNRNS